VEAIPWEEPVRSSKLAGQLLRCCQESAELLEAQEDLEVPK
jgi:hypothetical protein